MTLSVRQDTPVEIRRRWTGVCTLAERTRCVPVELGESTYRFVISPSMWRLGQRRNYRVYRHQSIPAIVSKLLGEWGVVVEARLGDGGYPSFDFRVQYGESDLQFVSRLLEEAGITYFFETPVEGDTKVVLSDAPHDAPSAAMVPYEHNPSEARQSGFHEVRLQRVAGPKVFTLRDFDFRRPGYPLVTSAPGGNAGGHTQALPSPVGEPAEHPGGPGQPSHMSGPMLAPIRMGTAPVSEVAEYEQYHYLPNAFAVESATSGGRTPVADAEAAVRHDESYGYGLARRMLEAEVVRRRVVALEGTAAELGAGSVFELTNYPGPELDGVGMLLMSCTVEGSTSGTWVTRGQAVVVDVPYRPRRNTPKPRIAGTQSAVVVGPQAEEIHTDEYGRVKVQFPWDREADGADGSSCWLRVDYASAGIGYGQVVIPHVGQEVLVAFLEGDPDAPVVVGRVFNETCPPPHRLPDNKHNSSWKSIPRTPPQMPADTGGATAAPPAAAPSPAPTATEIDALNTPLGQRLNVNAVNNGVLNVGNTWAENVQFARTTSIGFFDSQWVGYHGDYQWGENRVTQIGLDDTITIGRDHAITVVGDRNASIVKSDTNTVGVVHRTCIASEEAVTTFQEMAEKIIVVSTSDATVTIDGSDVSIEATGNISLNAEGNITLSAGGTIDVAAGPTCTVTAGVIHLNP